MKLRSLHTWSLTPKQAVALQRELACEVEQRTPLTRFEIVAGADVAFTRKPNVFHAAVVVLNAADGTILETQEARARGSFPYVPGLLSFREAPVLLEAFAKVRTQPDVVLLDGQGFAHPRRFGLACHIGLWLDRPCLGCAKSILIGQCKAPRPRAGSLTPLVDGEEVIGQAVRTRTGVKPVYVSVGHKIDLASAVRVVLGTCRGYRLPEPTRQADRYVNELRRRAR